jgi:Ca2+-transporting ATPase
VVETLGSVTVLCVDKTGTLTLNQMAVKQLLVYSGSNAYLYDVTLHEREPLPEVLHPLIEFGILASRKDPFDPMEKALQQIGWNYLAKTEHLHSDWQLLQQFSF